MGEEDTNEDVKLDELSKLIKTLRLEKLIDLDKLFEKINSR